ncbi:MAG: cation-translocating P-type ATPase [Deltaproteobacteria bacterium]|nr:cation-translocating P-type ATPase [Deltaproteobacteria bacterium]
MPSADRETLELSIDGMDCADEAEQIEKALHKLQGVLEIKTSVAAEKVTVSYDPEALTPAVVKKTVEGAGFHVKEAGSAEAERRADLSNLITGTLISVVAIAVLGGIVVERLGLVEKLVQQVPAWLMILAVLAGGFPIFRKVFQALRARTVTSHALMTIGILGALFIRDFSAAALIVFFMRLADFLETFTTAKSRQAIKRLIQLSPETARIERNGEEIELEIDDVRPGDIVLVKPGEKIPVDGKVTSGYSSVNQASITGESIPVEKAEGDEVFAATINERGILKVKTSRVGSDATFGRIIKLVAEAESAKSPAQKFADRVTAYYIPVVLVLAALTYVIGRDPVAAVAVLVVACSCAIAMATPIAVLASVGSAARRGVLVKGGLALEALARVDTVVMDKTGTVTFGKPTVTDVLSANGLPQEEILRIAASIERYSEHPLASAIIEKVGKSSLAFKSPEKFEAIPGEGIVARLNGKKFYLGNCKLMQARGVTFAGEVLGQATALENEGKTTILLADQSGPLGVISVADTLRDEVPQAFAELKQLAVNHLLLLTGDNRRVASALAENLSVEYGAELLPEQKIEKVKTLQASGKRVAMVGDGINDAPALAQADVGIAMGAAGTDVAIETAHVALMRDDWRLVPEAIRIGRRTFATIQQNLAFALLYNIVGISLAATGWLPPVWAAAAQSLPDVVIMLNSSRLLRS